MITTTTCKATLRSMLGVGLVSTLYDKFLLPSPEDQKDKYVVTDENGKKIDIPHPVHQMRIWNQEAGDYKEVQSRLEGAPEPEKASAFWAETIAKIETNHGKELVAQLLEEGRKALSK